ncbi:MAG: DctP family TRAP transporter solute-binding subunit, partial [Pseudomonadota bacterium]|nr:DctP family TRAP transporter solute-binding subunit [Pseudomonadota bacterium]
MKFAATASLLALTLAAGAAQAEIGKLNIKLSNGLNAEHPIGTGVEAMNTCLGAGSDGKVSVTPYWSHALGSEQEAAQALRAGLQEMMIEPPSAHFGIEPALGVFDLPFVFAGESAVDAALDGDLGAHIAAKMEPHNLVVLGFWEHGFRHVTNSRAPIETVDDLDGLRIRVMQNKIFLDTFDRLGANAIPMAWGELFAALETKAVDAEENPIAVIDAAKFFEVQDYLSLTGHVYAPLMVSYSKPLWDKLSEEEQTLIRSCVAEGRDAERAELRGRNDATLQKLA